MRYEDDRRLKVAYVDYLALKWFFELNQRLVQLKPGEAIYLSVPELDLPDDVRIESVHNADIRRGLAVVLRSASFDEVPRFEKIPDAGGIDPRQRAIKIQVVSESEE